MKQAAIHMDKRRWRDLKKWAAGKGEHRHIDMGLSTSINPQEGYLKLSGRDIPDWKVGLDHGMAVAKVFQKARHLGAGGVRLTPTSAVVLWNGRPRKDPPHFMVGLTYESGVEKEIRVPRARFYQIARDLRPSIEEAIVQSVMGS